MKNVKKLIALLLSAALAAGVMTGCGSSDSGSTAATDRTLTFGIQEYSIGVDPAQEINTAWNCSRYGIGECLFRFDITPLPSRIPTRTS